MKRKALIFFLLLAAATVWGIPAKRTQHTVRQPDGTTLTLTLHGDEHLHYYTTEDGQVMRYNDATGWWLPAEVSQEARENSFRRREILSRENSKTLKKSRPMLAASNKEGQKRGLVILVEFADKQFVTPDPVQTFSNFFNEEGYSDYGMKGSVRDYFIAQSYGKLTIDFDVVGPVMLNKPMAYYGGRSGTDNDAYPAEMVGSAVDAVSDQLDFSLYDWDGDGEVEQVYVIYAGYGEAQSGHPDEIWPHKWNLYAGNYFGDGPGPLVYDGVWINTYACSSELRGESGDVVDGIGTPCHEFSHCLGIPDLYDTQNSGLGMDSWSVMAYGSYNADGCIPASYTAYERWVSGWLEPEVIDANGRIDNLRNIDEEGECYVIYNKRYPDEYYLLQNIQQTGWNSAAASSGLLIIHVDYDKDIWYYNRVNVDASHLRVSTVCADGVNSHWTLEGDLYPYEGNDELTQTSTPAATFFNVNSDGLKFLECDITGITHEDGIVSFNISGFPEGEDATEWIDVTGTLLKNPTFENGVENWSASFNPAYNGSGTYGFSSLEFWQTTFTLNQTITNAPAGKYRLSAQIFYRAGSHNAAYQAHRAGTEQLTAELYAGAVSTAVPSIYDYARDYSCSGDFVAQGSYYPNNMPGGSASFLEGHYPVSVIVEHPGGDLDLGVRNSNYLPDNWCMMSNFQLEYCEDENMKVEVFKCQNCSVHLAVGGRELLRVRTLPISIAATDITWQTSNPAVATVDRAGVVTGVGLGTCTVTAAYEDFSVTAEVEVIDVDQIRWQDVTTQLIKNPGMNGISGWKYDDDGVGNTVFRSLYGLTEAWNCRFDFFQVLGDLPEGYYRLSCQAFFRPANTAQEAVDGYADNSHHAVLYAGTNQTPLVNIVSEHFTTKPGTGTFLYVTDWNAQGYPSFYLPNDMQGVSYSFQQGCYMDNSVVTYWPGGNMPIGVRLDNNVLGNWAIWDNFCIEAVANTGDGSVPTELTLEDLHLRARGQTAKLEITGTPENADLTVTWASDNEDVVTVNAHTGVVTARNWGVAHITATSTLDENVTAVATVTVEPIFNEDDLTFMSTDAITEKGICTYDYDMEKNNTSLCQMQPVEGWCVVENGNGKAAGVFEYGSASWLGGAGNLPPATDPDGNMEGHVLGLIGVWNNAAQYTYPIVLEAGLYTLTIPVYNSAGVQRLVKNQIGFITDDGEEHFATTTSYPVGQWTVERITFELPVKTYGMLSLGVQSPNAGSAGCAHLFIDQVKLEATHPADISALLATIEQSDSYTLGFDAGEYAPYNNIAQLQALAVAKEMAEYIQSGNNLGSAEVNGVIAALDAANWTVNQEEVNAIYNGDFSLCLNNEAMPGWTMSNNNLGGAYHSRAFVLTEGMGNYDNLAAFNQGDGIRSAAYLRFDGTYSTTASVYRYGQTEGYTMPLKEGVVYRLDFDWGGWGRLNDARFVLSTLKDGVEVVSQVHTPSAMVSDGGTVGHVAMFFTPGTSGDYVLSVQNANSSPNAIIVSNFMLRKAPFTDVTLAVTAAKYGTFIAPFNVPVPEGVAAGTVECEDNGHLILTEVEDGIIPANTPVVVYSESVVHETFHGQSLAVEESYTTGALTGVYAKTELTAANSYVLQNHDGKVGFYQNNPDSHAFVGANRCYLTYEGSNEVAAFFFEWDDWTDGFRVVAGDQEDKSVYYDLQGRHVKNPVHGVYVVDGKKIVKK